jgi:glucose/arabinose dehydrogenase
MSAHCPLAALANAHAVPTARAQEADGARPILETRTGDWLVQVVTDDLSYPWDINWIDNLILLTEAAGNIVMIEDGRLNRYQTSDPILHDGRKRPSRHRALR